jgi:hypothetical protein
VSVCYHLPVCFFLVLSFVWVLLAGTVLLYRNPSKNALSGRRSNLLCCHPYFLPVLVTFILWLGHSIACNVMCLSIQSDAEVVFEVYFCAIDRGAPVFSLIYG